MIRHFHGNLTLRQIVLPRHRLQSDASDADVVRFIGTGKDPEFIQTARELIGRDLDTSPHRILVSGERSEIRTVEAELPRLFDVLLFETECDRMG